MPLSTVGFIVGFVLSIVVIARPVLWIRLSLGVLNLSDPETQNALEELAEKRACLTPGRVRVCAIVVAGIFGLMAILSL